MPRRPKAHNRSRSCLVSVLEPLPKLSDPQSQTLRMELYMIENCTMLPNRKPTKMRARHLVLRVARRGELTRQPCEVFRANSRSPVTTTSRSRSAGSAPSSIGSSTASSMDDQRQLDGGHSRNDGETARFRAEGIRLDSISQRPGGILPGRGAGPHHPLLGDRTQAWK